jgi:ankyrin repeat protein
MRPPTCAAIRRAAFSIALAGLAGGCVHANQHSAYRTIHKDAQDGNIAQTIKDLAEDPTALDLPNDTGRTPLHIAASNCRTDEVRLLLERGAAVNGRSKDAATPLHLAAQEGCQDAARLLLAKGAAINLRDDAKRTPLDRAERYKQEPMIQFLRQMGGVE